MQNNLLNNTFLWFYKRFTYPLQLFTFKKQSATCPPIPLLHCFTKQIKVMRIIYNLAFLWYIPIISGLLFLFVSCNRASQFPQASHLANNQQKQKSDKAGAANIVFKSTDGGQTWQDISEGLPEPVKDDYGVGRNVFFADYNGLYLTAGNGIYHSKPNSKVSFWKKDIFPDKHSSIAPGKAGIFAYNYRGGGIFQKTNGTGVWSPVFTNFQEKRVLSVFETAGGTIFICSDRGLFKSTNSGKTWKHVGVMIGNLVESNGVLVATSTRGILRSTDDGENWALVISEGGVGIDVERIEGGFAAITFSTQSNTRRVRTSYDGGKTWQPIDAGLPAQLSIASIIQVGGNFFCGHPTGIFKSSDKGKTWKLLLPSIEGKVFNLSVSGNVIYAIPRNGGC
jgi:photosystem II stability/assembly factor-like uncharacterized protein